MLRTKPSRVPPARDADLATGAAAAVRAGGPAAAAVGLRAIVLSRRPGPASRIPAAGRGGAVAVFVASSLGRGASGGLGLGLGSRGAGGFFVSHLVWGWQIDCGEINARLDVFEAAAMDPKGKKKSLLYLYLYGQTVLGFGKHKRSLHIAFLKNAVSLPFPSQSPFRTARRAMARKKKASSGRGAGPSGGAPPSVMAASSLVSAHVGAPSGVGEEPKPGGDEVGMSETTNEMATSQGDASVPSLHANVGRDESSPENAPMEDTLNQESQREPPAMRFRFDSHKKLVWGGDGSAPSGDGSDSRLKEDSDSDAREVPGTTSEAHTTELVPGTEHTPLPVTGKQSQFTPQTQPPPEVCQPTPTVAEIVELETADPDSSPGSNARRLRSYGQTVLGIGHDDCLPVPESSPDDNDDYNADDLVVVRELNERLETARGVNGESSTWASGAEETCRVWQDKAFDLETELADERSLRNQTHQSGDYSQLLSSDLNILQLADTGRMSVAQSTVLNLVTAAAENAAFALGSRSRQSGTGLRARFPNHRLLHVLPLTRM